MSSQTAHERQNFLTNFQSSLDRRSPSAIICTGDFNDGYHMWNDSHSSIVTLELNSMKLINNNNLFQLINELTRITEHFQLILDLIISDSPGHLLNWGREPAVAHKML